MNPQLREAVLSGQVSAAQVVQHQLAGELQTANSDESDADWSENRPLSLLCFWQSLTFWRWVSGTAAVACFAMWLGAVYR